MRNDRILAAALRKREKWRMNLEIGGGQCNAITSNPHHHLIAVIQEL